MNTNLPALSPELLRACHQRQAGLHLARVSLFGVLFLVGAGGAVGAAERVSAAWQWVLLLPLYLLAGASLHGISLFTHEAVHGTLMKNRWWNGVLGALCAMPVLQNFSAYRVLHLRHHAHLGEENDPDHYAAYTHWTWLIFTMNWLRLLVGYPIYITAIPLLGLKHGRRAERVGILIELGATALLVWTCLLWLPTHWLLHGWLIPMIFINTMVNIRGMSQHTLLEHANDEVRGTRTILTTPLVRFFMCNENYHLEHHLYPGVPWHHLPQVHEELRQPLLKAGAPFIPSYASFVVEFVRDSIRRSPLGRKGRSRQLS
jgi:fatty acid desaturase